MEKAFLMHFNQLVISDSTLSDSKSVDCPRDNVGSYFKLPLPSKGLRFGQWNINHLTDSKFDQTKLLLTNNSSCVDVLFFYGNIS